MWAPDGLSFVIGCLDKEHNLCQFDLNGQLVYDLSRSHRIQDIAITLNGHYLIAMDNESHIHVYNFMTRQLLYDLDLQADLSSVSVSQDSQHALVRKTDGEIVLLDIDTKRIVQRYTGQKKGEYVIRSSFGGADERYVISGSEGTVHYIFCINCSIL